MNKLDSGDNLDILLSEEIRAVGNFLQYYETDLQFIRNFHLFLRAELDVERFISKNEGTFYSFLIDYRIIRNIEKGNARKLLTLTKDWCSDSDANDVDNFAKYLKSKGITRDATMTSLASKVLFLNNPWEILPMDALTRRALGQTNNQYADYKHRVERFRKEQANLINVHSSRLEPYLRDIEKRVKGDLKRIILIRKNRIADKLLWVKVQRKYNL